MSGSKYIPPTEVYLAKEDFAAVTEFWIHFEIPPVKVPGLKELLEEFNSKPDAEITLDECERVKYLTCYEIAHSEHEVFTDEMLINIKTECIALVAAMDEYYPGRVWI